MTSSSWPPFTREMWGLPHEVNNFGFTRLVLVNPCKLGDEAKAAAHAQDVLGNAEVCTSRTCSPEQYQ